MEKRYCAYFLYVIAPMFTGPCLNANLDNSSLIFLRLVGSPCERLFWPPQILISKLAQKD